MTSRRAVVDDALVSRHGPFPRINVACYACDAEATGVRDRRDEDGLIESACARHADPRLVSFRACAFCSGPRPSMVTEGCYAHKRCIAREAKA